MFRYLLALAALACVVSAASVAEARGGRGGGMGMICNTNPAPAQATQANLLQTTATKIMNPAPLAKAEPVFIVKSKSGVDMSALAEINKRPALNSDAPEKAIEFASK